MCKCGGITRFKNKKVLKISLLPFLLFETLSCLIAIKILDLSIDMQNKSDMN